MKRVALVGVCLLIYGLTSYGGLRSPDSEIVFRTAISLADHGKFAVEHELESWAGFGLARSKGGNLYSVFGPLESILLVPFVKAARAVNRTGWYTSPPTSLHVGLGLRNLLSDQPQEDVEEHALRSLCAVFNVLITTLLVWVFFDLVHALTGSEATSFFAGIALAFATPFWHYSGTFLSEPLAALLGLLSLRLLVVLEAKHPKAAVASTVFAAGACLGLAVCSHLTAFMLAPFFALYVLLRAGQPTPGRRQPWQLVISFAAGLGVLLILLGVYNYARFGDVFESGRTVDPRLAATLGYGELTWPWKGLWGLTASSGKSLFLYVPLTVLGIFGWPSLHRRHRALSTILVGAVVLRILLIATRSDWHGGFSLGPRFLLGILPFVILPCAISLHEAQSRDAWSKTVVVVGLGFAASLQQLYFVLGEVFVFYFLLLRRIQAGASAREISLYDDWSHTPLFGLLDGDRGPFLLQFVPLSNQTLFGVGSLVLAVLFGFALFLFRNETGSRAIAARG